MIQTLLTALALASFPAPPEPPAWLVNDAASRTVTLTLSASRAPDGTMRLNGAANGGLQIIVPLGWTVKWTWANADSAAHSLVLMAEREKLPERGGRPVFTNAMSRAVTAGLAQGRTDETTFVAEEAGWFWLLCGVPGHAIAGEYLGVRVDPAATTASVREKARTGS